MTAACDCLATSIDVMPEDLAESVVQFWERGSVSRGPGTIRGPICVER